MTNPGDDIYGSAEHQAFRDTVRRFVQTELVPRAREFDELGRIDKSLYRKMGELGLLGIRYDQRYGGLGLDYSYHAIFLEELSLCDNAGVAMGVSVQTDMATPALHRFGSEELKQRYLVPAIRGEQVAAIAVTEPGAGSDVAGIKTRAVRDGDHWVLNGSKMYITNAATADWLCLLAVTDPAAGYGGFTQIVVPTDARGFSYQLLDKIGNLGSDTGLLFFDDVRVPVSNTIGDPNRGFQQQMNQFQDERMVPVVMGPVTARHLWEVTLRHCQQRIAFGKPLAKMQVNQHKLVDMMIQITAAGVRAPLHPPDGARRGRDARHLDGEGVHHRGAAVRGDHVRAALRRRGLLLGEPRGARLRGLAPGEHRRGRGRGDEAGGGQDPSDMTLQI